MCVFPGGPVCARATLPAIPELPLTSGIATSPAIKPKASRKAAQVCQWVSLHSRTWVPIACIGFALWTAIVPFTRAFYRVEVEYNEGWNVYNAATVAAHQQLYPRDFGWTTVNYPMLSFVLAARLHRWTHDYLFTARVLSLLSLCGCCFLVGAIVRRLTGAWRPALLAGFFCLALFAVAAAYPAYLGMDDPQMLAQVFYLAALWIYVALGSSRRGLALAAFVFVVAISIKHNLIGFVLAVLVDLLLVSRRRAIWFSLCLAAFLSAAVGLQLHYGGLYFLDELLSPRAWFLDKALICSGIVLGPLILPLLAAVYAAWQFRDDPRRRIAGILLSLCLPLDAFFIGGDGVSINALFGVLLAMSILVGLFLWRMETRTQRWAAHAPLALFAWLLIPWLLVPELDDRGSAQMNWNLPQALRQFAEEQQRFDAEVSFLRGQPRPALCESLLRCYFAGEPFVYDPFNATRLVGLGRLNANVVADEVRHREFGAIQLNGPIENSRRTEMFAPAILDAIRENYQPVYQNQDGAIYLPNSILAGQQDGGRRSRSGGRLLIHN